MNILEFIRRLGRGIVNTVINMFTSLETLLKTVVITAAVIWGGIMVAVLNLVGFRVEQLLPCEARYSPTP